jgi:hypothetical protein
MIRSPGAIVRIHEQRRMKGPLRNCLAVFVCSIMAASIAGASNERLVISQGAPGHVIANVSAMLTAGCPEPTTFLESTSGAALTIYTDISLNCFEPGATAPYSAAVDVGPLVDGEYVVGWTYSNAFGPFGTMFRQSLSLRSGALLPLETRAIPTLNTSLILGLAALLAAIAIPTRFRKRQSEVNRRAFESRNS